jgi:WD40 repeat protein
LEGTVQTIAIDESGGRLIAVDNGGAVCVWQRTKSVWEGPRTFQTARAPYAATASTDGKIAALAIDAVLEAWDVDAGMKLRAFDTEPEWSMRNVAIDLASRQVIAGYQKASADSVGWARWNLDTGERLPGKEMPTLGNTYPHGIDLAKDGSRLAIGFDEALLVYDMSTLERTTIQGFDSIKAVAFSPANSYMAAANIRGWTSLWNATTKRQLATLTNPRLERSRDDLSFSADGARLAASNANAVHLWDLTKGEEKTVLAGHDGGISCAAFEPDGFVLATGGKDDKVRFWNPTTGESLGAVELGEAAEKMAFTDDGRFLAIGCMSGRATSHLRVLDVKSKKIVHESAPAMGQVHSVMWAQTPTGRRLAACGLAGVALWKVSSDEAMSLENIFELKRPWCLATVVDPAARLLVWVEDFSNLKAWDVAANGEKLLNAPPLLQGWHGLAWLPDKKSVIYISNSGVAEVWDVENDQRVQSIGAPGTFNAPHIALSPDGRWLAALMQPDAVSLWHRPTGKHIFSLRPETGTVWSLAWDASSENLAVGQSDGGLAVWHLPKIKKSLAEAGLPWKEVD